jgi:hypothetical protein
MAEPDDVGPLLNEAIVIVRGFLLGWPGMEQLALRLDRSLSYIHFALREEASARQRQRKTLAARKRLAKDTDELVRRVKRTPKYSTIEFKCLDDYEKCRRHRSTYDLFCIVSYLICILRRLIPFVEQAEKPGS